jgi:hypothetical protein
MKADIRIAHVALWRIEQPVPHGAPCCRNEHDVDALCYLHRIFDFSQKMERAYLNHFDKLDDVG